MGPCLIALALAGAAAAQPLAACSNAPRLTCVVDGDTVWIAGEKIRLAGIDAPEVEGECAAERRGAARAAQRLAELLGDGPYIVERTGVDRYGRSLAAITVGGSDIGAVMVAEGFARPWSGHRGGWCGLHLKGN